MGTCWAEPLDPADPLTEYIDNVDGLMVGHFEIEMEDDKSGGSVSLGPLEDDEDAEPFNSFLTAKL